MSFTVAAVVSVGIGVAKAIDGGIKAKAAKDDAEKAQIELDKHKSAFSQLDTSNPYLNMENTMEDLTVNTQSAEFAAQESNQNRANIMQNMKGQAGGSGIAALAQTLANSGSLDAQKASASIGRQESNNQMAERRMAGTIQNKEIDGEILSRNAVKGKTESMMAMSADEVANARRAQQSANAQMWDGIGSAASAVGGMSFGGGAGGEPKMGMGSGVNPGVLEDEWASSNTNLGYQDWLDSRDED
tara:strand:+ start:13004 stop:13735 length:732 start_codon:yes stop_codon:yes gene_type:complete